MAIRSGDGLQFRSNGSRTNGESEGLLKRVQLTISGCVGPCDVPNVVVITRPSGH